MTTNNPVEPSEAMIEAGAKVVRRQTTEDKFARLVAIDTYLAMQSAACPSCGGLNTSCPHGCGRDPATGELNGTTLQSAASPVGDEVREVLYDLAISAKSGVEYVRADLISKST